MNNPFVISGYNGDKTFCDRKEETAQLIQLIESGHNIVLTSQRRIGKTDLISHVFEQPVIRDKYITVSVDIYATQTFAEFVMTLGRSIIESLQSRGKKIIDQFIGLLQSLRAEITFDTNGMPSLGIGIGKPTNPETTLDEIFKYINIADRRCLIAIDEFQQIAKYNDGGKVEALLRTHIQKCRNGQFIFSGSQRHLMAEMFVSASRPFYMSATLMSLPLISKSAYVEFCHRMFATGNKKVEDKCVEEVYDMFKGITAYIQRVMNELYSITPTDETCKAEYIQSAIDSIINRAADAYETLFYQLSDRQRTTMLAISQNDGVENYTSSQFVKKYNLVSGSSVRSSVVTLQDKDLLTSDKGRIEVYDKFFEMWILRKINRHD